MSIAVTTVDDAHIRIYNELIERVVDQTDGRVDTTNVPTYIRLAEAEMNRRLATHPVRPMQSRESVTIDAQTLALPTDYLSTDSLKVDDGGKGYTIDYIEPENFDDGNTARQFDDSSLFEQTTQNRPLNYTVIGSDFYFHPTPTQSWSGKHTFYKRLTPLSNSAQSNWMLLDHPDVYYTGTLAFAYHYLPDHDASKLNMELFSALLGNVLEAYPKSTEKALLRIDSGLLVNNNYWDNRR